MLLDHAELKSRSYVPAGVWLGLELSEAIASGEGAALLDEMLPTLEGFDRLNCLTIVFWEAVELGRFDVAEHCFRRGDLLDPLDSGCEGPLHEALDLPLSRRTEALEWLVKQGADLERRGHVDFTPLFAAVAARLLEEIAVLVRLGAEVEARLSTEDDVTPLMVAALRGERAVVEVLLACGADPAARNARNRTAADLAEEKGRIEAARRDRGRRDARDVDLARAERQLEIGAFLRTLEGGGEKGKS